MNRLALVLALWLATCVSIASKLPRVAAAEPGTGDEVLLEENFSQFRSGIWLGVVDAHAEYHYLPATAPYGAWSVSTYRSTPGFQRAWRIYGDGDQRVLAQTYNNVKDRHSHPLVLAGDPVWTNYRLETKFRPLSTAGRSGLVFRCRNDRCYYFFGLEGSKLSLRMVQYETSFRRPAEKVVAEADYTAKPDAFLTAIVEVDGSRIRAEIVGGPQLSADDATYPAGKIGLMADVPTEFQSVRVTTTPEQARETAVLIAAREQSEHALQTANPRPLLWKRIALESHGTGRNVRFGDLDGDGQLDVLLGQIEHHGPKDRNSELSCLTALTLDGKQLWQIGEPDTWKQHLTNDVAFQIHDLDGDGKSEVVYTLHQELIVAEGSTGKTLRKVPTPPVPETAEAVYKKFPRVLGDALLFADFRGTGRDSDLVLKDRYYHFWTFDDQLRPLFQGRCNTGHYPYATDIDGDGHDELAIGYSLYDYRGRQLWTLENELKDHADGVAVMRMSADPQAEPVVFCCASDEGAYFADIRGNILRQHRVGHAQNPTVANLRDDLPGLEALSMNFWGNQGIIHLFNSRGEIYHDFEPCQHGSPCSPVNWTGGSEEFFLLTPNPEDGGLFDGLGRRVVRFPNDGHPDMCFDVLDLTGDCRDELVVWDPYEMWIYTQSDSPKAGRLYKPRRNPLYNASNYQAHISLPGWSDDPPSNGR